MIRTAILRREQQLEDIQPGAGSGAEPGALQEERHCRGAIREKCGGGRKNESLCVCV